MRCLLRLIVRYWFIHALFLPAWMLLVTVIYWQTLDAASPIYVLTQTAPVQKASRDSGLIIERRICSARNLDVTEHRSFVDGVAYAMPTLRVAIQKGCSTQKWLVDVPPSLPPGAYNYEVSFGVQANPMIHIDQPLPSIGLIIGPRTQHDLVSHDKAIEHRVKSK